jgi:hypothetical protein
MPRVPDPITSPPEVPGQPYDATSGATIGKWQSVDANSGPAGMNGQVTGDFDDGPGPWKQT